MSVCTLRLNHLSVCLHSEASLSVCILGLVCLHSEASLFVCTLRLVCLSAL